MTTPVERAGRIFAAACNTMDALPPHDAAKLAWHAGGPSVDLITQLIVAHRHASPHLI